MTDFTASPRFRCFNVKYSPNLGDGLLSECLEHALVQHGAAADSHSIDLAARTDFGDSMAGRGAIMAFLNALPAPLRASVVQVPLMIQASRKWAPHYRRNLAEADAMVIGGGNLLADLDLNFPTKLSLALEETAAFGLPAAIYACGMSSGWSKTGLRLMRTAFQRASLRAVFLRDTASVELWNRTFAETSGLEARLVRDPGLMAADLYPAPVSGPENDRPVVGLGLMSPLAIRYHSDESIRDDHLARWYVDLAKDLIQRGFAVHVFTNGSPEDRSFAATIEAALRVLGSEADLRFVTQTDPRGLCANIARFDVMVAHRMHALIAAYSYAVPMIALAWDRKVLSFMQSVDRGDWLISPDRMSAQACGGRVAAAVKEGIAPQTHRRVLMEARDDVGALFAAFAQVPS